MSRDDTFQDRACLEMTSGPLGRRRLRWKLRSLADKIAWECDVETSVIERREGMEWAFRLLIWGPEGRVSAAATRVNAVARTWEGKLW